MGTVMQLLLEALRANVGENRNEQGRVEDQLPDEMSGFILENVQVATMPYIEIDEDQEQPNPLLQLLHNREIPRRGSNPKNINKILDHIGRLEKKVKVLERCVPQNTFQQRLWLAPTKVSDEQSYDGSDYYPEGEEEEEEEEEHSEHATTEKKHSGSKRGSHASKAKSPPRGSPKSEEKKRSRMVTRPVRLEKEERSCFARLLFSRCWTGKEHAAGWKIKRRCPTGHKASLSCPCGQIGPCKRVKGHAVPIDQMQSTARGNKKKAKATASPGGGKYSQKGADSKNQQRNAASPPKVARPNGKSLYEKLFPCCFKDHMHTECCCRCRDNPPLTGHKKSKDGVKKTSISKVATPKTSADQGSGKGTSHEEDSGSPSEETGDEEGSDHYDEQSEYQTFNVPSISNTSPKNLEKINYLSQKQATGDMQITSKRMGLCKNSPHHAKKEAKSYTPRLESNKPVPITSKKSTTSFQIMLHPEIPDDQIVEPEVVSHQILKTLSTIHGPVKVEQKIVVQGTKNSVVIVTHGEACQCNLCNMLKGKMHPKELVEGLSPQVVKISTDNGYNTLINHSDGCRCELCLVLDPAVTKNTEHRTPQSKNENLVMAACSTASENVSEEKSTPNATVRTSHSNDAQATPSENHRNGAIRTSSLTKKSKCKTMNQKKKTKKCRCTKCRQRRRIDKLKLRLKKEMGTEYNRILLKIKAPNDGDDDEEDQKNTKERKTSAQSDSDDNGYVKPMRTKRLVSFSDEPNPKDQAKSEGRDTFGDSNERKRICKLCEVVGMDAKQANGIFKRKDGATKSWHGQNNNSTVYSTNTSSHGTPCECQIYGHQVPKECSDNQLKSKSKSNERGVYRFKSEEQKCFPPGHMPKCSREKQVSKEKKTKDKVVDEFSIFDQDTDISHIQHGSSCSGKCRREGIREDANGRGVDHPAFLLQEGGFPQKFVCWAPGSRSNMATAYSSESYYVPDQEEFPVVNVECDESEPSSGGAPVHRVQIPVWFRMLPDRKAR